MKVGDKVYVVIYQGNVVEGEIRSLNSSGELARVYLPSQHGSFYFTIKKIRLKEIVDSKLWKALA